MDNAAPNAPPKIAAGLNAPTNTAERKAGNFVILIMINSSTIATNEIAIKGTILFENLIALLIPPKVKTATIIIITAATT